VSRVDPISCRLAQPFCAYLIHALNSFQFNISIARKHFLWTAERWHVIAWDFSPRKTRTNRFESRSDGMRESQSTCRRSATPFQIATQTWVKTQGYRMPSLRDWRTAESRYNVNEQFTHRTPIWPLKSRERTDIIPVLFCFLTSFFLWTRELTWIHDRTVVVTGWGEDPRDHIGCRLRERFT